MASTEPKFDGSSVSGSYTAPRAHSSASTWYLVVGAAILLTILYLLTTGLMRQDEGLILTPPVAETSGDAPAGTLAEPVAR